MLSDYGAYTTPVGTVIVTSPVGPHAQFTVTSPAGSQQVGFDASGSAPGIGTIDNYHWNWGDGSGEDDGPQTPVLTHSYPAPGSYRVTLTVTNSSYQSATSLPQTVDVEAAGNPATVETPSTLNGPLYAIPFPSHLTTLSPPAGASSTVSAHATLAGRTLNVRLSCPVGTVLCAGTVRIATARAFVARAAGVGKRSTGRKTVRLVLGQSRFSVPGGQRKTVPVHLSARGVSLLRKLRRLSVLVVVSAPDSPGANSSTDVARLTLSASALSVRNHAARKR